MHRLSLEPLEPRCAASTALQALLDALASPGAFDDRAVAAGTLLGRLCAVRCAVVLPALAARQQGRVAMLPPGSFTRPRRLAGAGGESPLADPRRAGVCQRLAVHGGYRRCLT